MEKNNGLKLCFSTLPCMDYNAVQLKALCEKFNIQGVEVRQSQSGEFVYGSGLNVVDLGTGICLLGYETEKIEQAKIILRDIEQTDIKAIRIFLGNFAVMKTYAKNAVDYDGIVKAIAELADVTGKEIWIETHNEFATGRVLKMLLDDIGRGNVKVIWDIIHPIEDFEQPQQTWEYIGDRIAHVHIKDGKVSSNPLKHDYEYTDLGEGELPIKEILSLLKKENFDGYISLEWESPWRDELKKYDNEIEAVLKRFTDYIA